MTARHRLRQILPSLPLAGVVLLYVLSVGGSIDGYATAAAAKSVSAIFLIAPTVGAWAAWRGGIVRRGRVRELGPSRSLVRVAARELTPVVLGGLAVLASAVVWGLAHADRLAGTPDLRVVGMGAAVVVGHAALGYAVGMHVTPVIAVPSVFVGVYLWMVFPQAWEPLWLRHLTGFKVGNCCLRWEELDPGALAAPAVVSAALLLAAVIAVAGGGGLGIKLVAAVVVVAVGGFVGASFVSHLGPDPVRPRAMEALVCEDREEFEVCVWPQSKDRIDEVVEQAGAIRQALEPWGVRVPRRLTEASSPPRTNSTWTFRMGSLVSTEMLHLMLLDSLVPNPQGCPAEGPTPDEAEGAHATLVAWLGTKTGVPRAPMTRVFPSASLVEVDSVVRRSSVEQREWFQERRASLERCSPPDSHGRG